MIGRRDRGLVLFLSALAVAIATAAFIGGGVSVMRTSIQFSRAMRRIAEMEQRGEMGPELERELRSAARFARRPAEWRRLVGSAWRLDSNRWQTVRDLASQAAQRFRREGTWRMVEALASIHLADHERALAVLGVLEEAGSTTEQLILTAAAGAARDDRQLLSLLRPYLGSELEIPMIRAVAAAVAGRDPTHWWEAWQSTQLIPFARNAALAAAASNDRDRVSDALAVLAGEEGGPLLVERTTSSLRAELYLAAWVEDSDRLFRVLRSMEGRAAVAPDALLVQADGNLQLGRLEEAERIYRELRTAHPEAGWLPYANGALLALPDFATARAILEDGVAVHPHVVDLRIQLAALLVERGRRADALRVLAPLAVGSAEGIDHDTWLFLRAVLGTREPLVRFESDLWNRLNDYPDAHALAAFLARFLTLRSDGAGLEELAARYPPSTGGWAATLHAVLAERAGRLDDAESHLRLALEDGGIAARRNLALFALRHLPRADARQEVEAYARAVTLAWGTERGGAEGRAARTEAFLARAEAIRLFDGEGQAVGLVDRAVDLNVDESEIYAYRALLASPE